MTRMVQCAKLGIEAEGLERPPLPGELGQKIYDTISKEAWAQWLKRQTMLINENQLQMIDPAAVKYLQEQMKQFLFEGGGDTPDGYTPPS